MDKTFTISRDDIYSEVKKTTEYAGKKMQDDGEAYDRIGTTDEDNNVLERFFSEATSEVCQKMRGIVSSATTATTSGQTTLTIVLSLSASFDEALTTPMQENLKSFFVQRVTALWFVFTNKKEAGGYADKATALLDEFRSMAFHKKKPTRPTYN